MREAPKLVGFNVLSIFTAYFLFWMVSICS